MTAKVTKKTPIKKTKTPKARATAAKARTVAASMDKGALRIWNLRLGLLLVALAVTVVLVGSHTSEPVTVQYLAKDALASEAAGHEVLATATRHLVDIRLSWVVAKFLL